MAEGRPDLLRSPHQVNSKTINIVGNAWRFEPMIAPGDGAMPSCAIIDEYHERQRRSVRAMLTGMGARGN